VPSHLLASSLSLVIAQRLLRRLCDHCKTPVRHTDAVLLQAGIDPAHLMEQGRSWHAYSAQGCTACHGGLRGRLGVFQVMPVTVELQHLMVAQRSVAELAAQAAQAGVKTLRQVGLDRMRSGLCTLEDVLSGTPH
jgi:type IV pilus assembly protein PilB